MSIVSCAHCGVGVNTDENVDDVFTVQFWNKVEEYCGWCSQSVLTVPEFKSYLAGQKEFSHSRLFKA